MSGVGDFVEMFHATQLMSRHPEVFKDTHGNVSMRRDPGSFLIKPSGMKFGEIRPDDFVDVRLNDRGRIVQTSGSRAPSVDTKHHAEIYHRIKEIGAICHSHSPYATAFAMAGHHIECASTEQADYFGGPIFCLSYRDFDAWHVWDRWGDGEKAVLLQFHGALTFGKHAHEAVELAVALENVAQKTYLARNLLGARLLQMPVDEADKWHKRYNESYGQP